MCLCNEVMLCINKSFGVVVIINSQFVVVIFINGIVIKEKFVLFIRKRLVVELDIIIFSGKENKEGIGKNCIIIFLIFC